MAYAIIKPKRGTELAWDDANPILKNGELGIVIPDESSDYPGYRIKIGDGVKRWSQLPVAFSTGDNLSLMTPGIDKDVLDTFTEGFFHGAINDASLNDLIEMLGGSYVHVMNINENLTGNFDRAQIIFGFDETKCIPRIAYRKYINGEWTKFDSTASASDIGDILAKVLEANDNAREANSYAVNANALAYKVVDNVNKITNVVTSDVITCDATDGKTVKVPCFTAPKTGMYFIEFSVAFPPITGDGVAKVGSNVNLGEHSFNLVDGYAPSFIVNANAFLTEGSEVELSVYQTSGNDEDVECWYRYSYIPYIHA